MTLDKRLERTWERITEEAVQETDPQKHLKLIDELLSVMSHLQAARTENNRE